MKKKRSLSDDADRKIFGALSILFAFGALVFVVVGISLGFEFAESAIVGGPEVVVATPDSGDWSTPTGQTVVRISHIDDGGLRTLWNVASAAILLGIAVFLFGLGLVLLQSAPTELFSQTNTARLGRFASGALVLVVIGGFTRVIIEGRVIDASGLVRAASGSDDDFSLFIFDVPFILLIVGSQMVAWLWQRAAAIQSDLQDVV